MKSVKVLVLTAAFGIMATSMALAKDLKIAYVDLSRVFDSYQKTKEYDGVLQKESEGFQKERDGMIQKIRDAQSKLALMKDNEKQKLNDDIEKQKTALIEYDKQKRADLAKKRDDKVREILLEIEKVVSTYAQKEGYDYILNDRVLIYGNKESNVTEAVLKNLNDSYKK